MAATVECGDPEGPFNAPSGTQSIDVVANTDISTNDIVLRLYYLAPTGSPVASQDTLFSPEAIHYEPMGGVPPGSYYVVVCPFSSSPGDYTAPYTYHGTISMNTAPRTGPLKVLKPPEITMMMITAISLNFIGVGDSRPT